MTITAIRPTAALAADDPRHGQVAGRSAGCTCPPCLAAAARWKASRNRRICYGTWAPWVDATPVKDHLRALSDFGIGWEQAATLAGLPQATVSGLLYPRGKKRHAPATKCRPETARALLAVTACIDNVADHATTHGTGTVRRMRALVAIGHTLLDLGRRLPMHPEAGRRMITDGGRVTGCVARAARDLYSELWDIHPQGWTADRARRMAARRDWCGPLAWDDDTIDDPAAEPDLGTADPDLIDHVAVDRALDGHRVALTGAERLRAVAVGRERGMTLTAIALALRLSNSTVHGLARQITSAA